MRSSAERLTAAFFVIFLAAAGCGSGRNELPAHPDAAPDFLLGTRNGTPLYLSGLQGSPLALFFMIDGIEPCSTLALQLRERAAGADKAGVRMVTVSRAREGRDAGAVAADARLLHVRDAGPLFKAYGVTAVPTLIGVDTRGVVVARRQGYDGSGKELDAFLDGISKGPSR